MFKIVVLLSAAVLVAGEVVFPVAYNSLYPDIAPQSAVYPLSAPYYSGYPVVRGWTGVQTVPMDTPEVAAAKLSHYQAKVLATYGIHTVKKRSEDVQPEQPIITKEEPSPVAPKGSKPRGHVRYQPPTTQQ